MPDTWIRTAADEWSRTLADLGVRMGGPALVAGQGSEAIAAALVRNGAPAMVDANDTLAVLGPGISSLDGAGPTRTGARAATFDLVVLQQAWSGLEEIAAILAEALRVTRHGGAVVMGCLNADLLAESLPAQYASCLLYRSSPAAREALLTNTVTRYDIDLEAVRASLREIRTTEIDMTRAVFAEPGLYAAAVESGFWRGSEVLSTEEREDLGGRVATEAAARADGLHDREPWQYVCGFRAP